MLGHVASPQFLVQQAVDEGVLASHPPSRDLAAYDDAFSELVRLADSGDAGARRDPRPRGALHRRGRSSRS